MTFHEPAVLPSLLLINLVKSTRIRLDKARKRLVMHASRYHTLGRVARTGQGGCPIGDYGHGRAAPVQNFDGQRVAQFMTKEGVFNKDIPWPP